MQENVLFFMKHKHQVCFFQDSLPFGDGLKLMKKEGFTAMPVVSANGMYLGTVTEGDFLYFIQENYRKLTEEQVEKTSVVQLIRPGFMPAVKVDVNLNELFEASLKQNFVPVVDDRNIFIGIVTRQQIIRYLLYIRSNPEILDNSISQSLCRS